MSDPIDSAITAEHARQEEAFERAHACMDFCSGFSTEALQRYTLREVLDALDDCRNAMHCDNPADGWWEIIEYAQQILAAFKPQP